MPETMSQDLAEALCKLLDRGYELTFSRPRGSIGYLAELTGPLGSSTTGDGKDPAAAVASAWPLGDLDEAQAEEDEEPYCVTCGASVGIFLGHGDGWHHWRGQGTAASPVELFDAGHAPEVAWRPAGAQ